MGQGRVNNIGNFAKLTARNIVISNHRGIDANGIRVDSLIAAECRHCAVLCRAHPLTVRRHWKRSVVARSLSPLSAQLLVVADYATLRDRH